MLRRFLAGFVALVVVAGVLVAEEIKAKVKKYEDDKITVTANDKEHTFDVTDDTKVVSSKGKQVSAEKVKETLKRALKKDAQVTITVEKKDGKNVLTEIKLPERKGKKDK